MSDNILPISNVIDVTVSSTPIGVGVPNVNNIALFTNTTPIFSDPYQIYKEAASVGKDYGTDSREYKMAQNIFAQSPNILSGGGQLIAIPLTSTNTVAASGYLTTSDLSSNISNMTALSSAALQVHTSAGVFEFDEVDLTGASTIADLAVIFQTAFSSDVTVTASGNTIKFSDPATGADSIVSMDVFGTSVGTDLSGIGYLNKDACVSVAGTASGVTWESVGDAVLRTKSLVNYTGVATVVEQTDAQVQAAASSIQAQDLIFVYPFYESAKLDGIISTIQQATQTKTRSLYYADEGSDGAFEMCGSYIGRMFCVDFASPNSTITANMKTLSNVVPDGSLTQATYDKCKTNGADCYPSYGGMPRTFSSGANSYLDRVYNQQAFKFSLQTAGFNYLSTNTKIAQTTQGMDGLRTAMRKVCEQFVRNGYIAAGTWNASDTFGNPEDFKRNIEDYGYFIYSTPIGLQAQADREARIAPAIQIAIKEAGAIHSVIINVIAEP